MRTITPTLARRLAITRQHLAGERAPATATSILNLVRDLGCIQIDPISAVARSPLLVLFSRLGVYDPALLNTLLFQERTLFEYWAHCASIVPTEDYPLHAHLMRTYARDHSVWSHRIQAWVKQNDSVRREILSALRKRGPLLSRHFIEQDQRATHWVSTGWTSNRNAARMLDYLLMSGKVTVAGREGIQKVWDLTERFLPAWTPREKLSEREIVRRATQRSLRALGVATPKQITQHFIRGRYPRLEETLTTLEKEKLVERVHIADAQTTWDGEWYIHTADLPLLEKISAGAWQPRTTLLSPFDNLICDRARTKLFFDFDYTMEIYVPAAKRKYGYYVLPILHGDQLIGRVDAAMDRAALRLNLNAIYAEKTAPRDTRTARAIHNAIETLATFLGAREIAYPRRMPRAWK